ncbi:hypothetical protein L226DRAFT_531364 [Lentinus tigrinus ALCF2SS1-7]|uniref:Jacalin-type lectin domain-containing protein n=1 Tax=Lentinus tigrinus ALCF2SS1-6 TaxID=1328759 RepID=A0A5C2RZS5_9APHY|nr:hypothetical protein L227DRAFT_578702 [Lentinus tigrinus ALCF2SS1-6]RPD79601.1 hypothetical protein L226DRAFT_531364 [Lentinus tigrinus ALCF2SS1-7]
MFNDVFVQGNDGHLIVNDYSKAFKLHRRHPIRTITVYYKDVVEGIAVTYRGSNSDGLEKGRPTVTMMHGTPTIKSGPCHLGEKEVLVGVFGRAGPQRRYGYVNSEKINSIGFVIFHTEEATIKIKGPWGNGRNDNQGTPFWVSDVVAFGGFARDDAEECGLSGLFFIRDMSRHY